ncbi:MAG: ABC transporter permease subunit [Thermomicrobiales bacterium]
MGNASMIRAWRVALPWLAPVSAIIVWQVLSSRGVIPPTVLPEPVAVGKAGASLITGGRLGEHVLVSTRRAMLGLAIGGSIGLQLRIINGDIPRCGQILDTTVQKLRTVPHLALIPLVILWFGIGEESRIFLVALGVLFPIYINTYHGVRNVDPALIEMAENYGVSRGELFRRVILPGAMPSVLLGFRYALGIMWLTLIVAETISASNGIGYVTMNAREFLQTDVLVFATLLYAVLGKLADLAARLLERRLLAWNLVYADAA